MPRGGRESLTRAKVVRAAVELADSDGLEAVTMRRLAEALDVVPMALYKHVADKDDLLAGMVDALVEEMAVPPPGSATRWRDGVREALHAARRVVGAHPWARRAIESRTVRTPAVLGHMERVSALFLAGGFTPDQTHHVMHLLGNRIWGFSPELFTDAPDTGGSSAPARRGRAPEPDPADYPAIIAIATDARARRPDATGCDEEFEFDFALDVLLGGIERLRRAHWSSP